MAEKFLSVAEFTFALKRLIEDRVVLDGIWIKGEISNFKEHTSGHLYFTLKDSGARLSCVMFRSQAAGLKFRPIEGQGVTVTGRMSVYEKNGTYQLYVDKMRDDGIGKLYQAFDELKQRLEREGLFDAARKKTLPPMPQKIGLITSPTGAAVQDMIKILRRRCPSVDIMVIPSLVQGTEAPASLIKSLQAAAQLDDLDLVIIGRGGGSIEELWAFNDEGLAREIAAFPKPIISAVGHETDFTIADFVADVRAATPSMAAELAVPDKGAMAQHFQSLSKRLYQVMQYSLKQQHNRLEHLQNRRIFTEPLFALNQRRQDLDLLREHLEQIVVKDFQLKREKFSALIGKLDTLSPLATLSRGYALALKSDGTPLTSATQVVPREQVQVQLASGSLLCEVLSINENSKNQ